jgi:Type II secretion system (T2SS), protein G
MITKRRTVGFLAVATLLGLGGCKTDDGSAKARVARIEVRKYAFEAYPQWSARNMGSKCPSSLADLGEYMSSSDGNDPWGHPYVMVCGENAPADARRFGVISYGADGKPGGTGADADIASWEK